MVDLWHSCPILKGGASRCPRGQQKFCCPVLTMWFTLWQCSSLAVEGYQGLIFLRLACTLRHLPDNTNILYVSKLVFQPLVRLQEPSVGRRPLQPCKFQLKMSLEHNIDHDIYCTRNMATSRAVGTFGAFTGWGALLDNAGLSTCSDHLQTSILGPV